MAQDKYKEYCSCKTNKFLRCKHRKGGEKQAKKNTELYGVLFFVFLVNYNPILVLKLFSCKVMTGHFFE